MREITDIIQGKRDPNSVNLYLDGEYYSNIPIDFVVEYSLSKGKELSDDDLKLLDYGTVRSKAYKFMLESLSRKLSSIKDMRDKLTEKGYPRSVIDEVIEKGKEYGYLDDAEYAKAYVEFNSKRKGEMRIKQELSQHGISGEIVDDLDFDIDVERRNAVEEAKKYSRGLDLSEPKDKNKLIRHMLYKGYKWDIINYSIENMDIEFEE